MNEKEIGEIRRHLKRERSNITAIYGCYVNTNGEIIAEFRQSTGLMPENESDKYYGVLRKVLSGGIGRNLIDITFKTSPVAGSPEHQLLMDLKNTKLNDEEKREVLCKKIIESVSLDSNYVILLACDAYDVPFKSKDDSFQKDSSEEVYTYVVCAVCPVKETKPNLRYVAEEKLFHDGGMNQMISAPAVGFLFPAFDQRATNIYNALYYTRDVKQSQEALVEAIFNAPIPQPAAEQKKTFEALLSTSLEEDCNMDLVQTVYDQMCQRMEMHKEAKVPEPLLINKEDVKEVLSSCGVSEEHLAKFSVSYDEAFGFEADLHPKNIIDNKHFEIETADALVKVNPASADLIETRIIDGVKYLLIPADEDVMVNGVSITIAKDPEQVTANV